MTFEEFDKFQSDILAEVVRMKNTKGREYANGADRFGNFNRLSQRLGIPNYMIGWVYLVKHLDSIETFMKDPTQKVVEPIFYRFVDVITYLTLIAGMLQEYDSSIQPSPQTKNQKG